MFIPKSSYPRRVTTLTNSTCLKNTFNSLVHLLQPHQIYKLLFQHVYIKSIKDSEPFYILPLS